MSELLTSLEDLRKDIAEKERTLTAKQSQQLALMQSTKSATGERVVQQHEADQIRELEGQNIALTDQISALKLDYIEMRTKADLERRSKESFGPGIHNPEGGGNGAMTAPTGYSAAEAFKRVANQQAPADLGEAFLDTPAYKGWVHGSQGQRAHIDLPVLNMRPYAMKATLTTATGPFTSIDKQPDVVILGTQMFTIADLFATAQTNNTTIRFIQEDTLTKYATGVAEEAQKPEATWDLSEVDVVIKKIAVVAKVTSEMFEDYPQIRSYINDRLPWNVRQHEELQLINGTASATEIGGVLTTSGILTQAKATDSNLDAIYKALTKVRTQGFWEPDAIVIHPTNWTPIRLLKTTTGEYVYGDPSMPGPETVFGKRVVVTANMVANTALVGSFRIGGTVYYRHGLRVEATNSDQNDFVFNRIALRCEVRECLVIWRPKAFCSVTGLDAG